jgi:hypothetical protein
MVGLPVKAPPASAQTGSSEEISCDRAKGDWRRGAAKATVSAGVVSGRLGERRRGNGLRGSQLIVTCVLAAFSQKGMIEASAEKFSASTAVPLVSAVKGRVT